MKIVLRLFFLALMLSGWAVAAMCLHIVRTPNPADANSSKLVVIPKARLGINQTYVDARGWTMSDIPNHAVVVTRMLEAGKADQLKFLADPKSKQDIQSQLSQALGGAKASGSVGSSGRVQFHGYPQGAGLAEPDRTVGIDISF